MLLTELDSHLHNGIINCLNTLERYKFKKTGDTAILSIRILSATILRLCEDAFNLLEQGHIYTSCSLVCQATESQIQLLCIDKLFDTKGKDYYEYAFVEQLRSLPMSPHWKDATMQRIRQYNCERFYKGKGDKTNIKNYDKYWYSSFASTIQQLSEIAFPHLKDIFHAKGLTFLEEDLNINLLYENYQTLCSFKHFSPFITGSTFLVQDALLEKKKDNHLSVALTEMYIILLSTILILNNRGEKLPLHNCFLKK